MPVLTISIDTPSNGADVTLNIAVSGSVTPRPSMMSWQVDANTIKSLPFDAGNPAGFNFEITAADCPDVDTWYILNVYAWDDPAGTNQPSELFIESTTFKRVAPTLNQGTGSI